MRPRDLRAAFIKATRTFWTDVRQPTRAAAKQAAIEDQDVKFIRPPRGNVRLDSGEREWIERYWTCPFCQHDLWEGPQGGMATNLLCSSRECRARFNWVPGMLLDYTMREGERTYDR